MRTSSRTVLKRVGRIDHLSAHNQGLEIAALNCMGTMTNGNVITLQRKKVVAYRRRACINTIELRITSRLAFNAPKVLNFNENQSYEQTLHVEVPRSLTPSLHCVGIIWSPARAMKC